MRPALVLCWALVAGCGGGGNTGLSGRDTDFGTTTADMAGTTGGCTLDSQCGGATPRCDKNSSQCVPCLPLNDNCTNGKRCVLTSGVYACTSGCTTDADCPKSDAGAGESCCNGACIDTTSDSSNCGGCNKPCPLVANGSPSCNASVCGLGTCNSGFADCDQVAANGCEVNRQTDAKNCGQCGKACLAGNNQSAACNAGSCVDSCATGYAHCSANPGDGCEVNVQSDVNNCGGCGNGCALANASDACIAGNCAIASCSFGFGDCDHNPKNGCEATLASDGNNCGVCGNVCGTVANGSGACMNGACVITSCNTGFSNCDGLVINGCEVPTQSDPHNCGGCGITCMGADSTQDCEKGACTITGCAQGFADCDGKSEDGCEVSITADTLNCGGCNKMCAVPANGSATCVNAQCGVGACNFGYADCDKNAANGCEASLTSVQNCGQCGNVCAAPANASAGCTTGVCGIGMCNALYADCDKNPANGCEKSVATDLNNCGGCGAVCAVANGTPGCLNGQCGVVSCNTGYADCNAKASDGCEVSLQSDPNNCGKCGTVCPKNLPYCGAGTCQQLNVKVLIVYSSTYEADVKTYLTATNAFATIDEFNAESGTPTLVQLQPYGAVLVYSDSPFADPVTLGNNLADYQDGGGSVVIATFANAGNDAVTGRFGAPANGYMLVNPAVQEQPNDSLGTINEPQSSLMVGVAKITATAAYRSSGLAINGGIVVAAWLSGKPMVVRGVVKGRNMVALNFYPPSSATTGRPDFVTGDVAALVKNALLYR